jgi:hypothetical protein
MPHSRHNAVCGRRLVMLRKLLLALTLWALLGAASIAFAQNDGTIHLPPSISQSPSMGNPPVSSGDDVQKQQAKAANQQRQAEIRRDTEKMFELTTELKDYLLKSDQGTVSVDAIKKAEQIEKLAHSVKSKMKQSF